MSVSLRKDWIVGYYFSPTFYNEKEAMAQLFLLFFFSIPLMPPFFGTYFLFFLTRGGTSLVMLPL